MAPRPLWKGYLKLSLISCPIALYPAISGAERISFRQINKATGNRLRHQLVDSVTGERIESHAKGRGYQVAEDEFVLVKDEELESAQREARSRPHSAALVNTSVESAEGQSNKSAVPKQEEIKAVSEPSFVVAPSRPKLDSSHTIEIVQFVPTTQIDPRYYHTPYYLAPRDEMGREAFAVIRDAMSGKALAGMGHVVLSSRERPVIVEPTGKGMRCFTLRYTHEVRNDVEYFAEIPELILPKEMVGLAERILEAMKGDFDPRYLEDRYRTALISVLEEKQRSTSIPIGPATLSRENVVDLMDVLKRSLAAERAEVLASKRKLSGRRAVASAKSSLTKRSRRGARGTR